MSNHHSVRNVTLAAAMAAALAFGAQVHAQTGNAAVTPNNNDALKSSETTTGAMGSTSGTKAQRAEARAQARADRQQAMAAKRAARNSASTTGAVEAHADNASLPMDKKRGNGDGSGGKN